MLKKIKELKEILTKIKMYQPDGLAGIAAKRELFQKLPLFLAQVEVTLVKAADVVGGAQQAIQEAKNASPNPPEQPSETSVETVESDGDPGQPPETAPIAAENNKKKTKKKAKKAGKKGVKGGAKGLSGKSGKNQNGGRTKNAGKVVEPKHDGSVVRDDDSTQPVG